MIPAALAGVLFNTQIDTLFSGESPERLRVLKQIKSGELNDDRNITQSSEHITEDALNNSSVTLFKKNTLLIAMYGATAGKLGITAIDTTTNQAVCSIQNTYDKFNNEFLFYFLYSIRKKIIDDSFGGAQPNISKSYLEKLLVYMPNLEIQKKCVLTINELINKNNKVKFKLKKKLNYLKNLKSSILSKAFSGDL